MTTILAAILLATVVCVLWGVADIVWLKILNRDPADRMAYLSMVGISVYSLHYYSDVSLWYVNLCRDGNIYDGQGRSKASAIDHALAKMDRLDSR